MSLLVAVLVAIGLMFLRGSLLPDQSNLTALFMAIGGSVMVALAAMILAELVTAHG